ncbi:cyclic GMP-AMP synthase DncV-like nucleotidyltransferase [Patescibacteria group bacterium]
MIDCSSQLKKFHDDHVRLSRSEQKKLASLRDTNLKRLTSGLKKLSEKDGVEHPSFKEDINQGSYAMHTLNQHSENDYDIDIGIVFGTEDLPSDPLEARKRVAAAMKESGDSFKKEPEARTNAVTMWYADGCHVDFAVYREVVENGLSHYEHASTEWRRRDPLEMNKWFKDKVDSLSPKKANGATVEEGQMRRIVRLVKFFTKSRSSWNLPGGMIISTLVAECYSAESSRDDISLVKTLITMASRLKFNHEVDNPVEPGAKLTGKDKFRTQVAQLSEKLGDRLSDLEVLDEPSCDEPTALLAWQKFFNHPYWTDASSSQKSSGTKGGSASGVGADILDDLRKAASESKTATKPWTS